jgi:uracil-DNA glycosylase
VTDSWRGLGAEIAACTACAELARSRERTVPGERPRAAWAGAGVPLAFVGEAPGAAEDAAGRPFVGKAGQLLDQLLDDAALDRSQAAVLNVLKCRPPSNRAPRPVEVASCRPYLERQLALLRPHLVVALGLTAVTWFLGRRTTLAAARGRVHRETVGGVPMRVLATYHPSAAIRFGASGAPMTALHDDLAHAAKIIAMRAVEDGAG